MEKKLVVSIRKVILDVLSVLIVICPFVYLKVWGEPFRRGFFCNDETLSHPYSKPSKLFKYFAITINLLVPVVILVTEIVTNAKKYQKFKFSRFHLPIWVWHAYCVLGVFIFGIFCSQLICCLVKFSVGRLRPNFFAVCVPNINCTDPINLNVYHQEFICTNTNFSHLKHLFNDIRESFPSGHSSTSMYNMVFFSIYIQSKFTWNGSKLLKHAIQFLAIAFSIYIGTTRISTYQHHWSDVFVGLLLGGTTAILVIKFILNWFSKDDTINDEGNEEAEKIQPDPIKQIV